MEQQQQQQQLRQELQQHLQQQYGGESPAMIEETQFSPTPRRTQEPDIWSENVVTQNPGARQFREPATPPLDGDLYQVGNLEPKFLKRVRESEGGRTAGQAAPAGRAHPAVSTRRISRDDHEEDRQIFERSRSRDSDRIPPESRFDQVSVL